jgi:dienelactone hydrolase
MGKNSPGKNPDGEPARIRMESLITSRRDPYLFFTVFGQHEAVAGTSGRQRVALATLGLALVVGMGGCATIGVAPGSAVRAAGEPSSNQSPAAEPPAAEPAAVEPAAAEPAVTEPAVVESMVWVPAGDHQVPGTLTLPAPEQAAPARGAPAVLMLHGDLGNRDGGGGDLFGREAAALAAEGIGSLRIDFAGSGDSTEPDLALDYPNMVADATASVRYLQTDPDIDPSRIAILGLSRGGSIAATLAGTLPGVAALVEWSGAVYNGYDEDPDAHQQARENGYVPIDMGDRTFELSLNWYDSIEQSHPLDDVAGYQGPVLAVVDSNDDVVPPTVADVFLATVASKDTTLHTVAGGDHLFGADSTDQTQAEDALAVTADWLGSRLVQSSGR